MARLTRTDRILLATLLPAVVLVIGLHLREALGSGIPEPPVFAAPAPDGGPYPVVGGLRLERGSDWSGLEPGDRLIALGDRDLRGVGYFGFDVVAIEVAGRDGRTTLTYERDGVRHVVPFEMRFHSIPWSRVPGAIAFMIAAVWVLLRSPGSRDAQLLFVAFASLCIFVIPLQSTEPWLTWTHLVIFNIGGSVAMCAVLLWAISFPPGIPSEHRLSPWWALLGSSHIIVRVGYWLPGSFSRTFVPNVALAGDVLFIALVLGFIARNYRYAGPVARRRVMWVVLATGIWASMMGGSAVVGALSAGTGGFDFPTLLTTSGLFGAIVPIAIVISVVRYNLFDINRLLSATAAYSLALVAAAVATIWVASTLVDPVSARLDLSPVFTQSSLLVLLACIAIPVGARMRPRLDRLFFPDRAASEREAAQLLRDLPQCERPDDVMALVARRVHAIFRAHDAGTFVRRDGRLVSSASELRLEADGSFARLLERNAVPLRMEGGRARALRDLDPEQVRAIVEAGIEICVPLRVGPDLVGFVALGGKVSGDVFAAGEIASLGAIAAAASAELLRMRDAGLLQSAEQRASEMDRLRARAEKASQAKSSLLAAVSHDLRQPLHAIGLLAETLAAQIDGDAARSTLSKIRGATTSLSEMIASLLDLSRLEAGTLRPEVGDFALDPLILGLVDEVEEVARRKRLRLRFELTGLFVRTDALMLARIVRNLLSNAVRCTDKGGVTISAVEQGDEVELRIRDTGPGIPLDQQGAIFEEFVRLEPGGEGLGLGLAIVKGLSDLLGHRVTLTSEVGQGTTFSVFVPRAEPARPGEDTVPAWDAEGMDDASAEAPAAFADRVARPFTGRLVVVVDDDLRVLDAMRSMLEEWGASVIVAATIEDVVSSLERTGARPDLVIADYHLGSDATGIDAIETIRGSVGGRVVGLAITAETSSEAVGAIRGAGLPLLTKPVKPARLRAVLTELLAADA